jgi:hypothetical protein
MEKGESTRQKRPSKRVQAGKFQQERACGRKGPPRTLGMKANTNLNSEFTKT